MLILRIFGALRGKLKVMMLVAVMAAVSVSVLAQKSKTDSLLALLPSAKGERLVDVMNGLTKVYIGNDTARAKDYNDKSQALAYKLGYKKGLATSYNHQGTIYYYSSSYTADTLFQIRALNLFEEIGDKEGIARSYANIGLALYAQSQYKGALQYHKKALEIRKSLGDKETIADSYTSIGIVHHNLGEYSDALFYQLEALKIREKLNNKKAIALSDNYLGNIYRSLRFYDKALECYQKALLLYEQVDEKLGVAIASNNVGQIYASRGENKTALQYFQRSLEVYNNLGNRYNRVITHNFIGKVYQDLTDYTLARTYYTNALIESIEIGNKQSTSTSYNHLGELDLIENRNAAAIINLEKARQIAEESSLKDELSAAYLNLSKAFAATGNYKEAYSYHSKYSSLQNQLGSVDLKQLSEMTNRALVDSKNKEIQIELIRKKKLEAEVKKQKAIKYSFIAGSLLLLVFLVVLFNRFRLINRQKQIIETEQKRSDSLLLNILPADVAEELKRNGSASARSFNKVSVMFADIQNFTKIGEKLSPEKLVAEIDFYFKAFDNIITKYGIEKIKTIGDAYMCAAGLYKEDDNSATDMVHAALELQAFVNQTRIERVARNEIFFEIRIGIHTGAVVAGIVGLKKFAYDIWGDAVNTAARMETAGETNKINISEATFAIVREHFDCTYRGKLEVKNKGMLDMYFVDGVISETKTVVGDYAAMKEYVLNELAEKLPSNLYYHGVHHTKDVLDITGKLAEQEKLSPQETELVKIAALFHDSGFITTYHDHEDASCTMARATLPLFGFNEEMIVKVCDLIMATRMPQSPKNHLERILCDADLDYLGRDDYDHISDNLFRELKEYGYVGDDQSWKEKQHDFLTQHRFFLTNSESRLLNKENNLNKLQYPEHNNN